MNVSRLTITVEQAAEVLGIARSTAYELVRSGDIESIRLRRRIVVPVAHLAARLGVGAPEVWSALEDDPPSTASPTTSKGAVSALSDELLALR